MIRPADENAVPESNQDDCRNPRLENLAEKSALYCAAKRIFDVCFSLTAMAVLSPLMILIALIIYLDDPKGGPIFSQIRCGLNGRQFKFYKFRTMVIGAERQLGQLHNKNEMSGPVFKIRKDPRITRVGSLLRKTSLDEMPQFFNVLRGEMSLVGPRPPLVDEYLRYSASQRQRLSIRPGITCYWQVQPDRNNISFDNWMELDLKYIRERSMAVDLMILMKTFFVMCTAQGE